MVITKDLGAVSAYAYAVEQGYQGTEEEFAELMARQATVAEEAAASADAAAESASEAQASAEQAEQSAQSISGDVERAEQAATTATGKATEAATSATTANGAAQTATGKASEASASATAAANSASAAAQSATNAASSATAAQTAQTAAETAQGKAEDAQAAAEAAAQSVSASAAQIAKNTDNFASAFSASTTYAIGDYCIYQGTLYRFINEHTGAWSVSDVEATNVGGEIGDVKSALSVTTGTVLFNDTHSYAGGAENWSTIPLTESVTLAIRFPDNSAGVSLEVAANVSGWIGLDTISDDAWHIVTIPDGVSNRLVFTYRGTSAFTTSCLIIDVTEDNLTKTSIELSNTVDELVTDVNDLQDVLNYSVASYGNNGDPNVPLARNFLNFSATPCKRADKGGQITSLYVKSETAGTTEIYVGEVDQLYLFVPRQAFTINLSAGEQNIDVSNLGIYINEGEQVLIRFIGRVPFSAMTGEPQGDNSFYYSENGGMQLQVLAAQRAAVFGFGYTVTSTIASEQTGQIIENTGNIGVLQGSVSELQANANIISDRSGNKYRMIVQNGAISLLSMNFNHVLCVGNSYTTHPTTTDTEADYRNNLWWGHWSMAASGNATAWTTLLQNALRQKINNANVTPVFGRRYETNYNVYNLSNSNTFTYWDGSAWRSLKDNLASFSDVDAIVFFLGANYSGDDWYTLYKAMVEQFLVWFPNVSLFCCSCSAYANAAKDGAIQQVANEELASYISMVGINGKSKIGSYVKGDDGELHQINNAAVAGHFGDYGEYLILDRVCNAMGYTNNSVLRNITINSITGVTLSVISTKTIAGAIISVFADVASGASLSGITVTSGGNTITVTDHGETDYGRVFTFVMPEGDATITAVSA